MDAKSQSSTSVIMTEEETASFLRVKRFTLRKWRREGSGPRYIRCGGRLIRYILDDVTAWLSLQSFGSMAAELKTRDAG